MPSISIQNPLPREVLNEICHAVLCPDRPWNEGLKTLASLARTCRLFHEPAINVIWRDIPDLLPLIHTLPEDLWLETHIKTLRNDRVSRHFKTQLVRVALLDVHVQYLTEPRLASPSRDRQSMVTSLD